jgi:hypothetical protein
MKQLPMKRYKALALALCLTTAGALAQKQTRNYREEFKIQPDAVIDINTSYADIQFETWDKNEVLVEGTIELEGATEEEARAYFDHSGIEILGNSKTVEIRTSGNRGWASITGLRTPGAKMVIPNLDLVPDMESLLRSLEIPEMPPMPEIPPLPPMPNFDFDYDAFQKDGEKYMKKWKKEFNKSFDKEFQDKMEAWGREYAERAEVRRAEMEERRAAMEEQRAEMQEQRQQLREQAHEARQQAQEARQQALEEAREEREKMRFGIRNADAPNIFFHAEDGGSKSYKVKKTIRIRMPKSAILKMNVRHGEVKLAANTRNIHATLSYARLHAPSIEGDQTEITASYSPVKVGQWKYGNLNTSFTDAVELDAVTDLKLKATSSEVRINKVLRNLISKNELGAIYVAAVDPNFRNVDIEVRNGEVTCVFPKTDFAVSAKNTYSDFTYPSAWTLKNTKNGPEIIYTGTAGKGASGRTFKLRSTYSSVVLQ